jgi:hypothetical protein
MGADQAELEWTGVMQGISGGQLTFDENGHAITTSPEGGVGGMIGGITRVLTFRLVPIERDPSSSSLRGMDVTAAAVPVLDPAEWLVTGTTVTGLGTSRGWAAFSLV